MKCVENYYRRVLPEPLRLHTTIYFNKFLYVCNQIIKLCCGENCSRIAAAKLDLRSLIEKNSTSGLITATEELYTKLQVWGRCNALYRILVTSFQQEKQHFLMC